MTTRQEDVESGGRESIRALISSVKTDAQSLLKAQVELTSTEMKKSSGKVAGVGGLFIGALLAVAMGGIFVLITLAYVLVALGLPVWAGFGIVALLLLIVGGVLALVGRGVAKGIKGPKLAKIEWEKNQQALSGKEPGELASGNSSGPAAVASKSRS